MSLRGGRRRSRRRRRRRRTRGAGVTALLNQAAVPALLGTALLSHSRRKHRKHRKS